MLDRRVVMLLLMMMMMMIMMILCVYNYDVQSYYYLDLLSVMCVSNEVARPDNQSYIAQILLRDDTVCLMSITS